MRAEEIHPGDVVAGKYRVRTILSRSPTLVVEGFHVEFDQRVVIKLLLAGTGDDKEIERFRREARVLAKLESEHTARILDVGTEPDGMFYLVRQLVEGEDLESYITHYGPRPLAEAVLFVLQAAEAVAETHGHGIILRELSPEALMVTRRPGGEPQIKITEFGTAKLLRDVAAPNGASSLTATALFGLTPYSSPELVRKAKNVDGRTDVWSLGAILYALLAGRSPFTGDMASLMLAITREDLVPVTRLRGDLPSEIDHAIGWAMAKDLDARFKHVYAFVNALRAFASPEGQVLIDRIARIHEEGRARQARGPASMSGSSVPPRSTQPGAGRPVAAATRGSTPPNSSMRQPASIQPTLSGRAALPSSVSSSLVDAPVRPRPPLRDRAAAAHQVGVEDDPLEISSSNLLDEGGDDDEEATVSFNGANEPLHLPAPVSTSARRQEHTEQMSTGHLLGLARKPAASRPGSQPDRPAFAIPPPPPSLPPSPWQPGAARPPTEDTRVFPHTTLEPSHAITPPSASSGGVSAGEAQRHLEQQHLEQQHLEQQHLESRRQAELARLQQRRAQAESYPGFAQRFDTVPPSASTTSRRARSGTKGPDRRILWGAVAAMAVMLPVVLLLLLRDPPRATSEPVAVPLQANGSPPTTATPGAAAPDRAVERLPGEAPGGPVVLGNREDPETLPQPKEERVAALTPPQPPPPAPPTPTPPSVERKTSPTPAARPDPPPRPEPRPEPPKPEPKADPPEDKGGSGTLMAIASGGTCNFGVDGGSRGSGKSLRVSLPAGKHTVTCRPTSGAAKSKGVTIKPGETSMLTFTF